VTNSVAVYLDAESYRNTLQGNSFHADHGAGSQREVLAVDGSSNNLIMSNHFSSLQYGGIYLYRNCGEGGTIRHSTPSNNSIINNVFYYDNYTGSKPLGVHRVAQWKPQLLRG